MTLAQKSFQSSDPSRLADIKSLTAYKGRVCKFCETVFFFFHGETGNPLKEQTVSEHSHTIYSPTGKMLFIHEAHLLLKVEQATPLPEKIFVSCDYDLFHRMESNKTIRLGMRDA